MDIQHRDCKVHGRCQCPALGSISMELTFPACKLQKAPQQGALYLQARALGFTTAEVNMKGLGFGKQRAVRALHASGLIITVIREKTPVAHNGCRRPRKKRN